MSLKRANSITTTFGPAEKLGRRSGGRSGSYKQRGKDFRKRSLPALMKGLLMSRPEKKIFQITSGDRDVCSYSSGLPFSANNVWEMGPNSSVPMAQGTGSSDRIGNKIRVIKVTMRLIINVAPYDATTNPFPQPTDVRMLILHAKNNPTDVVVSSTFFEENNSTGAPDDNLFDMLHAVNKDVYVVSHDQLFKCGNAINQGTGGQVAAQYMSNNDYKFNHIIKLDVTKMFPKTIQFNDASSIPTSFQPTLVMLGAQGDGGTNSAAIIPVKFWANTTIEYVG